MLVINQEEENDAAGPNGNGPDPEVAEKATRRRFSAEYKRQIVREADTCTTTGEVGALLRREGLCSSSLSNWRRPCAAGDVAGTGGGAWTDGEAEGCSG